MRLNTGKNTPRPYTHEGGPAKHITPEQELRRSVLTCLLWENTFYEDGVAIADRITDLANRCSVDVVSKLAMEARNRFHLRHVPLLLLKSLVARGGPGVADTVEAVIQRPDEMGELLSLYWQDGKRPIAKQLQRGLARAFNKFDAYQLAKYNRRDVPVKLRDVLFLTHAKPVDAEREALYKSIVDGTLQPPDTWEVALTTGADKKETFSRLITEQKLGYMALLRNLRGMVDAGVDRDLISDAIVARRGAHRVLPFRYVAAARACPQLEPAIDKALIASVGESRQFAGETIVLIDVSGSMHYSKISARSDMRRVDVAAALGSVLNCERMRVFTFANNVHELPPRTGMAGVDAIVNVSSGGTMLGGAVSKMNKIPHDRIIVITDEQAADKVPDPVADKAYMINVAPYKNGVGYGKWVSISGWSNGVIRYIHEHEDERSADVDSE